MVFKNISMGVYYPGSSLLHRLQARTKLLIMVILVVALVVAGHFYWDFTPYAVAFSLVMAGIACSGISPGELWRRLWLLFVIVALSTCLGIFVPVGLRDSGRVLYILPSLALTSTLLFGTLLVAGTLVGLYLLLALLPLPTLRQPAFRRRLRRARFWALFIALLLVPGVLYASFAHSAHGSPRLAYMLTYDSVWYSSIFFAIFMTLYPCSLLLTMTTSPVALIEGLTMLMTPLRWLRLPVDDFALMTLLALRFIPTLLEEMEQLAKAQAARGSSFSSGSLRERAQSVLALFVPFMRNTLRRASELAIALDARGYQTDGRQTRLHEKALALPDYLVLVLVGGLLLTVLLV
ncbi:MAG TPA: energy-coupling factor transporter transmembrane component T [Ktedonobacteraceae bacterium]|nr:energy-coupling factor transporter transmembrane component T [Ktedonobacteraceae bacterium]